MKKALIIIVLVAVVLVGAAITAGTTSAKSSGKTAVATFYPVFAMTNSLLEGTSVEAVNMTSGLSGCIHDYQLKSGDMKAVSKASVLVINGLGMEHFVEKITENNPKLPVYAVADKMGHGPVNPHTWMNPSYLSEEITGLSKKLQEIFPKEAEIIAQNEQKYTEKLSKIAESYTAFAKQNAEADVKPSVICFHEAFGVFADSVGFSKIAEFSLDEHEEPSAGQIAEAIEQAKKSDRVYILIEEAQKEKADKIVKETGADVICIDPLTSGDGTLDSFFDTLTANLDAVNR